MSYVKRSRKWIGDARWPPPRNTPPPPLRSSASGLSTGISREFRENARLASLDGIDVEQTPSHSTQLFEDKGRGHSGAIRSVRGHRIVYVCHRKYARLQKDVLAGQTPWITAPVNPLVMLVRDLCDR